MQHGLRSEFEVFLVEDVILTLGNLRGSLSWLGTSQLADPAIFRAGLDRLDRQIGLLEDRARALKRDMVAAADAAPLSASAPAMGVLADVAAAEAPFDLELGPPPSEPDRSAAGPAAGMTAATADAAGRGDDARFPLPSDPDAAPQSRQGTRSSQAPFPGDRIAEDWEDLNIFGSDPDLSSVPPWSRSPLSFRSRRSAR